MKRGKYWELVPALSPCWSSGAHTNQAAARRGSSTGRPGSPGGGGSQSQKGHLVQGPPHRPGAGSPNHLLCPGLGGLPEKKWKAGLGQDHPLDGKVCGKINPLAGGQHQALTERWEQPMLLAKWSAWLPYFPQHVGAAAGDAKGTARPGPGQWTHG